DIGSKWPARPDDGRTIGHAPPLKVRKRLAQIFSPSKCARKCLRISRGFGHAHSDMWSGHKSRIPQDHGARPEYHTPRLKVLNYLDERLLGLLHNFCKLRGEQLSCVLAKRAYRFRPDL